MKIEFDFKDETERKSAEELFDRFSTLYSLYTVIPGYCGNSPTAGVTQDKMMSKNMFLYALQSVSVRS